MTESEEREWATRLTEALNTQTEMVKTVKRLRIRTWALVVMAGITLGLVVSVAALAWETREQSADLCRARNGAMLAGEVRFEALFDVLEQLFPESIDVVDALREANGEAAPEYGECPGPEFPP